MLLVAAAWIASISPARADDPYRALAERLASANLPSNARIEVVAGRVPGLPVAFSPPPRSTIVGTVIRRPNPSPSPQAVQYTVYDVYVDLPGTAGAAVDALEAAFAPRGYRRTQASTPLGGFQGEEVNWFATLCATPAAPAITIRAVAVNNVAHAQVSETAAEGTGGPVRSVCSVPATPGPPRPPPRLAPAFSLPVLGRLPDVTVQSRGGARSDNDASSFAEITANLSARALVEAWSAQLVTQGWASHGVASTPESAVATFGRTVDGRAQLATLMVARRREGHYWAVIQSAFADPPADPSASR